MADTEGIAEQPRAERVELSKKSADLFRVYKTIMKMLNKRQYDISREQLNLSAEKFAEQFRLREREKGDVDRQDLTLLVSKPDNEDDQLMVFFPEDLKLKVETIRNFFNRMQTENVHNAIVVLVEGMSPQAKQAMAELPYPYKFEHFRQSELYVDITEHQLVPEHQVLTTEEKRQLLERYKLRDTQLPRMQVSDPIARYFGLRRGQVVKIIRPSETAGRYVTYRLTM